MSNHGRIDVLSSVPREQDDDDGHQLDHLRHPAHPRNRAGTRLSAVLLPGQEEMPHLRNEFQGHGASALPATSDQLIGKGHGTTNRTGPSKPVPLQTFCWFRGWNPSDREMAYHLVGDTTDATVMIVFLSRSMTIDGRAEWHFPVSPRNR